MFFLSWTCEQNSLNQSIVINRDHVFDDYLTTELNISETFFLFKSIIKNNKDVLFDENLAGKYLNYIFSILSTIEVKDKRKAFLISILEDFCQFDGFVIRKNQTLIFKKFIEDGHNRI